MKFFLIIAILANFTTPLLKGVFFNQECGCEINLSSSPLTYTKFHKAAYSQFLSEEVEYFNKRWAHYLHRVLLTDEQLYQVRITGLKSEPLDFVSADGISFEPVEKLPKDISLENVEFDQEKLNSIRSYFDLLRNLNPQDPTLYVSDFFSENISGKNIIKAKLNSLLGQIKFIEGKEGTPPSLQVEDDNNLASSVTGFKISISIDSKFGTRQLSFLLAHFSIYEVVKNKHQFKHTVYFQEMLEDDQDLSNYRLDLDKVVGIQSYISENLEFDKGQFKKLNFENYYASAGLRELQQSCINSAAALREGIGAAISTFTKIYYGNYNVCLPFSILDTNINEKLHQSFQSFEQNEKNNIFEFLLLIDPLEEPFYHEIKNEDEELLAKASSYFQLPGNFHKPLFSPFVRSVISQNLNSLKGESIFFNNETESESPWENFEEEFNLGCQSFKRVFDLNLQNSKIAQDLYFIKQSNFIFISCSGDTADGGYLTFQGRKVMKFFFKSYIEKKDDEEITVSCFHSKFIMPRLMKSSLQCLKQPDIEDIRSLYLKQKSFQLLYESYYGQAIKELFEVVLLLDDMSQHALDAKIIYLSLVQPFLKESKELDSGEKNCIEKSKQKLQLPLLTILDNSQAFVDKRGFIVDFSYIQNKDIKVQLKLIEGEEDFLRLVFQMGDNQKEFIIPKFFVSDNVEISHDYKTKIEKREMNQSAKDYLQESYLTEIAEFLQKNLVDTSGSESKEVVKLEKDGYSIDTSVEFINKYASLTQVSYALGVGISIYQIVQMKFKETFLKQNIEKFLYEPVTLYQENIQLDDSIKLDKKGDYDRETLTSNFYTLLDAFTVQKTITVGEDLPDVQNYYQNQPQEKDDEFRIESLQKFLETLLTTHDQSYWYYAQNKNQLQNITNDSQLYFDLDRTVPTYSMEVAQKHNFLESFVLGGLEFGFEKNPTFILGNTQTNRFLIISFSGFENQYLQLLQISFQSLYFNSQFLVQLRDFDSVWQRIFDIIVSVSSHYKNIIDHSFDLSLQGTYFDMNDVRNVIAKVLSTLKITNLMYREDKEEGQEEPRSLIYVSKNSNFLSDEMPAQKAIDLKVVMSVVRKTFKNNKNGFLMKFYDSHLPIGKEIENQAYVEDTKKQAVHSQLEFYDTYNFDYLPILENYVTENIKKLKFHQVTQFYHDEIKPFFQK